MISGKENMIIWAEKHKELTYDSINYIHGMKQGHLDAQYNFSGISTMRNNKML